MVAEVRERLSASKRATYEFHMEGYNLKKPNTVEGNEKCQIKISGLQHWKA
jgi:hypothetical protein